MKADSTLRTSRAVPHPSTNRALCRLTSEVERDPVHSTRYGRQRTLLGRPVTPQKSGIFPRRAARRRGRSPPSARPLAATRAAARRRALGPTDADDRRGHHRDDHGGRVWGDL